MHTRWELEGRGGGFIGNEITNISKSHIQICRTYLLYSVRRKKRSCEAEYYALNRCERFVARWKKQRYVGGEVNIQSEQIHL